jgi:Reverse transcriptase (RNA-dependent DNA polymerase)
MDVKNILLQGTLQEEVYMILPPDHKHEKDHNIGCKLKKSIYGLKQSSRAWYEKLSSYLIYYNFTISSADHSLSIIMVLVYVDDIIIIDNNIMKIRKIKM